MEGCCNTCIHVISRRSRSTNLGRTVSFFWYHGAAQLWVAVIAFLIFGKHMTKLIIMGLAAGGLMLLVAPSIGNGTLSPIGISALIISSISWAIGSLYSSKAKLPISVLASSGILMITGGLMLTSVSFLLGEYQGLDLSQISGQSLAALIYLIIIITVVGFTDF